jgi:hypothetical protein
MPISVRRENKPSNMKNLAQFHMLEWSLKLVSALNKYDRNQYSRNQLPKRYFRIALGGFDVLQFSVPVSLIVNTNS